MSDPKKNKIPGPFLAVGMIAVLWVGSQLWPMLSSDDAPEESASSEKVTTEKETLHAQDTVVVATDEPYTAHTGPWSTYHGGPALQGVVEADFPDEPEIIWRFQADASIYYAPVSSENQLFFVTSKGGVFGLDFDGNELWSEHLFQDPFRDGRPRVERFEAPPSCFGETFLAGSMRGIVYAFDVASGEQRWTYDSGGTILGTINLHDPTDAPGDERVFVLEQSEGALHSIDLATGEGLWQTEGVERCDGSPAVQGDVIVFGSCAAALHVFSATDGTLVKEIYFDEESQVASGASIMGDSAYVGTHSGKLFHSSLNSGEVVWSNGDSEDEIFETPAMNRDIVVFSSYDGSVYAVRRDTGALTWKHETDGVPTSPIIISDRVAITTDGILQLLRLSDGEELWSYEISDEASSPAFINGMIVVGSDDGTVTAFGTPKG